MPKFRFYRGIAVPDRVADETVAKIASTGFLEGAGFWKMVQYRPGRINELFAKPDLSIEDTRPKGASARPAVCACGEPAGASYYAWWHNRSKQNDTPILIEFEAERDTIAVDGRDFLCTIFQLGDPERARDVIERAFGRRALRYAEKAWSIADTRCRIALCDLAIYDPEVIEGHYANKLVIGGRYRTVFRNAFTIQLPIAPRAVVRVERSVTLLPLPKPDILLDQVLTHRG